MRLIATILIALVALIVISAAAAFGFAWWSLPAVSGTIPVSGLHSEVHVVRDQWGIPHIFANDELDAFRALGFTAAQDRLFQMDMYRRLADGQLSEVLGPATVQIDELARTLGFRYYAEKLLASNAMNPDVLRAAEAYRDGLNNYIETQRLPVEFRILGYKPRKFEIVDMLAFGGYLAYSFSEAFRGDILYSDMLNDIPAEKVNELRGGIEESSPPTVAAVYDRRGSSDLRHRRRSQTAATVPNVAIDRNLFAALNSDPLLPGLSQFNGSNSWVVAPKRSKSGQALLANDPHIGFSKPAVWYEAHISTPTLDLYGHFAAIVPFAVLGHTRDIAWAITMSEVDDMDFYREKPDVKLDSRDETIAVRGAPGITLKVQTGPHGPLVQNLFSRTTGQLIAMKWQYHEPANLVLDMLYDLAHAKTPDQFAAGLKKAKGPGLNVSYVDKAGNIAWWVMGQIPIRPANSQPDMILDGASGADEYLGYRPFEDNPHLINPDNGMIITANNKPTADALSTIHGYFQPSERIVQLHRLLDAQQQWSAEEFMKVQTNQDEVFAADQVPLLLGLIQSPQDPVERTAYTILQQWKGHSDIGSVGAAIYNEWRSQILRKTLVDELGPERFNVFGNMADAWHFYKRLINNPASRWWDNIETKDRVETREDIVRQAFTEAVMVLRRRFGTNVDNWTWGKLHTIEYVHLLGRRKPLNFFFNAGPYPAGGNYGQVDAMSPAPRGQETFEVVFGPSTRRILDFSHIEKSWGISPLGNSGNLMSRHEKDQAAMYLRGEYRPELMDASDIQRTAETSLTLIPQ